MPLETDEQANARAANSMPKGGGFPHHSSGPATPDGWKAYASFGLVLWGVLIAVAAYVPLSYAAGQLLVTTIQGYEYLLYAAGGLVVAVAGLWLRSKYLKGFAAAEIGLGLAVAALAVDTAPESGLLRVITIITGAQIIVAGVKTLQRSFGGDAAQSSHST